ncbi:MAG: hypothetical protein HYY37_05965 [Candidatus Aenigmarchaeota archaeon]|nr:hypothetical protein [Candidatus Aenigmarchaeota archaeon]
MPATTTTVPQRTCTDSDGGKVYGTKGSVFDGNLNATDFCSGGLLYEYYCRADNTATAETYPCANGCVDGACVSTGTTTTTVTTTTTLPPTTTTTTIPTLIGSDLDVTYIARTPRYYRYDVVYVDNLPQLRAGTENQKRWPATGETVAYTAHVINKGNNTPGSFGYQWLVNNASVASGTHGSIAPGQDAALTYSMAWTLILQNITFRVDQNSAIPETVETNNERTIGSHDLTISIWAERGIYELFNNRTNLAGSYSFEDWIQAQVAKLNERFEQARYQTAPGGVRDRLRIDKIVVAENLDGGSSPMNSDPDQFLIDGRWQFADGDATNANGQGGAWLNYVSIFAATIDWGLIHEMAHQLGIIDLYRMNLATDPPNRGVQVQDGNGNVVPASNLPAYGFDQIVFPYGGLMGGGDTSPYRDGTYFESHTAGGMNAHYNHRRGYFGEYLYDTPLATSVQVLNATGGIIASAQIAFYQKDAFTEIIDNTPEISGTTNTQGVMALPNRPVTPVTTATGHTLRPNPFGHITVAGHNGTMIVKITKDNTEGYGFLTVHDLNVAYWAGNTSAATITVRTNYPKITL